MLTMITTRNGETKFTPVPVDLATCERLRDLCEANGFEVRFDFVELHI